MAARGTAWQDGETAAAVSRIAMTGRMLSPVAEGIGGNFGRSAGLRTILVRLTAAARL